MSPDPSPLTQTLVYMSGILAGYALVSSPEEWQRAWHTMRSLWRRPPR